jgi:lysozyme
MTLDEAKNFVMHVQSVTGTWPGLYGGSYLKEQLAGKADATLSECWLWLSQYGPTPVVPPGWSKWTLWQYADGHVGPPPYVVPAWGLVIERCFRGRREISRAFGSEDFRHPLMQSMLF